MKLAGETDEAILAVANPIMENLMAGSTEIDHARHTRDFSVRLAAIVTPEHLENVCRRYQAEWGFFAKREVAAIFRRPDSVVVIWRQGCTKARGEFVAEMMLVEEDGEYRVEHVLVF